ncbi:hypothetical protein DFJ73DRAFT_857205 [Zopfochytrium polystomum]|nr:hypothetical protein DFJ73DRAFT_857205 [Zopfochytrium polystomum]
MQTSSQQPIKVSIPSRRAADLASLPSAAADSIDLDDFEDLEETPVLASADAQSPLLDTEDGYGGESSTLLEESSLLLGVVHCAQEGQVLVESVDSAKSEPLPLLPASTTVPELIGKTLRGNTPLSEVDCWPQPTPMECSDENETVNASLCRTEPLSSCHEVKKLKASPAIEQHSQPCPLSKIPLISPPPSSRTPACSLSFRGLTYWLFSRGKELSDTIEVVFGLPEDEPDSLYGGPLTSFISELKLAFGVEEFDALIELPQLNLSFYEVRA